MLGTNRECPYSRGLAFIIIRWWSSPEVAAADVCFGQSSNNTCVQKQTIHQGDLLTWFSWETLSNIINLKKILQTISNLFPTGVEPTGNILQTGHCPTIELSPDIHLRGRSIPLVYKRSQVRLMLTELRFGLCKATHSRVSGCTQPTTCKILFCGTDYMQLTSVTHSIADKTCA